MAAMSAQTENGNVTPVTPFSWFATHGTSAVTQFTEASGPPAWKQIPSWSLIGTLDHVIPPPLQTEMASRAGSHVVRVRAGHLSLITRPGAVTRMILSAVNATT